MSEFHIVFPLYPGVTHLDFTGPHQVLGRLPGARVHVASLGGQDIEAEGLVFARLEDLAAVERCDLLCVPGGFGTTSVTGRVGQAGAAPWASACRGSARASARVGKHFMIGLSPGVGLLSGLNRA